MLFKLAWRNIWRNYRRSIIILLSIIIGLIAMILYDSLSNGMIQQMLDNQIGAHVSHIQIHRRGFNDNKTIQNSMNNSVEVESVLQNTPGVHAFSKRILSYGILSSPYSSSGVSLVGIEPEQESRITGIKSAIVEGTYLSGKGREIVIGRKLAEKLDVELDYKLVAMASALDGKIGSEVFRVVGIYQTFSSDFDKNYVYINTTVARELLALENRVSEYAVLVDDLSNLNTIAALLGAQLPVAPPGSTDPVGIEAEMTGEYEILTYRDLLPLLIMQVDVYRESIFIFYAIIGIAMIFGIINTVQMSVFERIQEFGVLMAVGMKNRLIFAMIILEAFYLGILGTATGMLLGYLLYLPLSLRGIDLSSFAEGLNSFGAGAIIYPLLTWESLISALLVVPVISILGAIYPAIRATRLEPVSAIRYV